MPNTLVNVILVGACLAGSAPVGSCVHEQSASHDGESSEALERRLQPHVARKLAGAADPDVVIETLRVDPGLSERERKLAVEIAASFVRRFAGDAPASRPRGPFGPEYYLTPRAAGVIEIDGRLTDDAWSRAPWTRAFVDIRGATGPAPRHATRVKLLWDDEHLYVAAQLDEPHLWGTLTKRDQIVFHDNDFEVFIDPDRDARWYYEIEVNTLGTIFDLILERPYREGGPAFHDWDAAGLRVGVNVAGTLNDPADTDRGWSVEMAIPFAIFIEKSTTPAPPRPGDVWRVNFSRVQWRLDVDDGRYRKRPGASEDNWVWSAQHEVNMHRPRRWGYVEFAGEVSPDRRSP